MAKKFTYRGKSLEELQAMTLEEFSLLLTSRQRRSLKRGFTRVEKKLLEKIRKHKGKDKLLRTHAREMLIIPEMIGAKIGIYTGREYKSVILTESMIGHVLGEFALTRNRVQHSAPGIGATRSSKFVALK
ncbi:MAG: 30S ribosomal protein S19 [Candidatus Aenigmarchaeota archaeon]|nr:30S ribosomal protein S19 [Candidatus Aenigmarchaeota archaeon]